MSLPNLSSRFKLQDSLFSDSLITLSTAKDSQDNNKPVLVTTLSQKALQRENTLPKNALASDYYDFIEVKDSLSIVIGDVSGGFMLGMLPEIEPYLEDKTLKLSPGDKLILYTDGITEARNPQEELFSLERLIATIERHGQEPPEKLLSSIKNEVLGFISTREQYDDITLVVAEACLPDGQAT